MELKDVLLRKEKLEGLSLKKEELPILDKNFFQIPIHPRLLDPKIQINKLLARQIFPKVVQDWYEDLRDYIPENKEEGEWISRVFLKNKPAIIKYFNHQTINEIWSEEVNFAENGFVNCFSINGNDGRASLYFSKNLDSCKNLIPNQYVQFPYKKVKEFEYEKIDTLSLVHTFSLHKVDSFPEALFLRNWAITWTNEALEQVF
ncbi:MAG: hypothetical protein NTZ83_02115 [Candidatus Pacearchaeota archaeon]|nr:hypothetical protein [Candidatus Pacearchaeota archaeon]